MGHVIFAVVGLALLSIAWMRTRAAPRAVQAVPAGGLAFAGAGAGEPTHGGAHVDPLGASGGSAGPSTARTAPGKAPSVPPPVAAPDDEPLPADVAALGFTVPFPHLSSDEYLCDLSVGDLFLHAAGSADGECDATEVMLGMARDELRALRSLAMESTDEGRALRSLGRKLDVAYELHRRQVAVLRGEK